VPGITIVDVRIGTLIYGQNSQSVISVCKPNASAGPASCTGQSESAKIRSKADRDVTVIGRRDLKASNTRRGDAG
jgi:hypothetical protein